MNRIAVIVSVLALGISVLAVFLGTRPAARPRPAEVDVERLESQVAVLTRQMDALKVGLSMKAVASARPAADGAAVADPVGSNLSAIAQRLAELEKQTEAARERGILPGPLAPATLAKVTATVLDRNAPWPDRVRALRLLRPRDGRNDERTPPVVDAMIEALKTPDLPEGVRERIIRDLEWVNHPPLKDPLVAILNSDRHPAIRAEAIESLMPFYNDPQVQALVGKMKESDPDPAVRREAEKRLAEWRAGTRSD